MGDKPKAFRLSFVNAAEDVPRLIRAYGRACGAEFGLVLRPAERRAALVRIAKEGTKFWRSDDTGDAPGTPASEISGKDAVTLIRTEQKALPKEGPITLRGNWSGYVLCDEGTPRVTLQRKLAAYGILRIRNADAGWEWTVDREGRWFSTPGADSGTASTLLVAIEAGLRGAMRLLGEACSVRDSHRRASMDEGYAAGHPVRPAKEGKDPTTRMKPPRERRKPGDPMPAGSVGKLMCGRCGFRADEPVLHFAIGSVACPAGVDEFRPYVPPEAVPLSEATLASLRHVPAPKPPRADPRTGRDTRTGKSPDAPKPEKKKRSRRTEAPSEGPAASASSPPPAPKRGRKPKAEPAPDAAKDRELVNLFSSALDEAMKEAA